MVHLYFSYIVQCLNEEFNDRRLLEQKITGKHVNVAFFARIYLDRQNE